MTDAEFLAYSEEHLMHEVSMLWEMAALIPGTPGTAQATAFIESFTIHLRNLIEFFFEPPKREYVRAIDFCEDPTQWTATRTPLSEALYARTSDEVTHLTTGRISGNPPPKSWNITEALHLIENTGRRFAKAASPRRLHPKVREFFDQPSERMVLWIGANVAHSNVASHVATVSVNPKLSDINASTATRMIYAVPLDKP